MIILGIETSCDETALSLVEAKGEIEKPEFKVLGSSLYSQVKIHEQYGGVFPMLAKREHEKNLIPLLKKLLEETNFSNPKSEPEIFIASLKKSSDTDFSGGKNSETPNSKKFEDSKIEQIKKILEHETHLFEDFLRYIVREGNTEMPKIDAIAVTRGPGLEPALWVGINFARALSYIWNIPIIPVNHMEGHIVSVLMNGNENSNIEIRNPKLKFPVLALLISGGHTELVLTEKWGTYKILGATRDDAVGEAFDKVARLLGLPYPGGPEISKLAEIERKSGNEKTITLPRPMIHSKDYDFSFAGLKTSVLYLIQKLPELTEKIKSEIALEFENAVTEVLLSKTRQAIEEFGPQTLIIAGGVSANKHIRTNFENLAKEFPDLTLLIPSHDLSTDNAIMIAGAGYIDSLLPKTNSENIKAEGNLKL